MPVLILGPTNQFPNGKLNEDDDGELQIAVGIENGTVAIHFGTPVTWLALDPEGARALAALLRSKAEEIQPERKEPL